MRSLRLEPGNANRIMRAFGACKRLIIPAKGRDGQRTGLQEGRTESLKSVSHLLLLKKDIASQSLFILHFKSQPKAPNNGAELTLPLPHQHQYFRFWLNNKHRIHLIKLLDSAYYLPQLVASGLYVSTDYPYTSFQIQKHLQSCYVCFYRQGVNKINSLPASKKSEGHIKMLLHLKLKDRRLVPERGAGAQPRPRVAMERLAWAGPGSGF